MRTDDAEAAYLRKRIKTSFEMASAATDECAQMAHRSLAILYERKLKALLRAMDPPRHRQNPNPTIQGDKGREPSKMRGPLRLQCPT